MALQVKESLDHIFLQLKSKNEDKRYGAALELHDLVVAAARGHLGTISRQHCLY